MSKPPIACGFETFGEDCVFFDLGKLFTWFFFPVKGEMFVDDLLLNIHKITNFLKKTRKKIFETNFGDVCSRCGRSRTLRKINPNRKVKIDPPQWASVGWVEFYFDSHYKSSYIYANKELWQKLSPKSSICIRILFHSHILGFHLVGFCITFKIHQIMN